ncbi:MAG: ABC transporter permease [Elusimicrobia bacterium RIFCSPLOWO2_01_FULL_59_12]|nr:MAG: ABC transporter permease [Elusimicrobia bacterium RIFCSPLOWO2_01_FULL_59_12]
MILQQLVNGLTLGSLYALIALGYTMVYGVLLMINFAHSEILMAGAFASCLLLGSPWLQSNSPGVAIVLAMLGGLLISALLALLMERLAYRPLRRAGRLAPLISAIGVSIFLQNAVFLFISDQSLAYPQIFPIRHFETVGVEINSLQLLILGVAVGLMITLHLFVNRTRLGTAIRATAQDASTASLMGIPVNGIIALTFLIGGALGGVAGALNGMYYGTIKYNMGFVPGLKAFTAAVLGGIGNIAGAMWGGFILGILESLAAGLLPNGSDWKDVIAFSILIIVLLFRPEGLFGRHVPDKV